MAGYLLKRLLQSAFLFWAVTVITFVIIRQAPGGPAILANPVACPVREFHRPS